MEFCLAVALLKERVDRAAPYSKMGDIGAAICEFFVWGEAVGGGCTIVGVYH